MKEYCFTIFLFLGLFNSIHAQSTISERSKGTHVSSLHEGILLVQLPNSDKKIKKLKELNQNNLAEIEKEEIEKIRKNILEGFETQWEFSDYVFFEIENIDEVLAGNYENTFNSKLEKVGVQKEYKEAYYVRYGPGNPGGEVYKYNGRGFQIKHINEGKLEDIKHDIFFAGGVGGGINLKIFFGSKLSRIHFTVSRLSKRFTRNYEKRLKINEQN